ncbi:uncharacterized protein IL334_002408 [Kwoniella shivajii]|uniref:Uncharacterized protein n=1 Tax=Kwoniella shivajii TaxID=564305 RepID=A0ABZ1CWC2_9TREE|nr:hypothetical protein IL334_002408 [Kwoniella shivajii]
MSSETDAALSNTARITISGLSSCNGKTSLYYPQSQKGVIIMPSSSEVHSIFPVKKGLVEIRLNTESGVLYSLSLKGDKDTQIVDGTTFQVDWTNDGENGKDSTDVVTPSVGILTNQRTSNVPSGPSSLSKRREMYDTGLSIDRPSKRPNLSSNISDSRNR